MVRSESDPQGISQNQGTVGDCVNDQVHPGQEFIVIHPELMRAGDRFADSVLDGTDDSLHCTDAGEVLGKSYSELNGGKCVVKGQDHLHLCVDQVFAQSDNIEPRVNPDDPRGSSQGECFLESSGNTLGTVVMNDLQVDSMAGEPQNHKDPSLEL